MSQQVKHMSEYSKENINTNLNTAPIQSEHQILNKTDKLLKDINERILENYLVNIKNLSYLSKEYAELKNDRVLMNNLSNNKNFKCKICNNDSETYSDNCSYCNSYDTLILK